MILAALKIVILERSSKRRRKVAKGYVFSSKLIISYIRMFVELWKRYNVHVWPVTTRERGLCGKS